MYGRCLGDQPLGRRGQATGFGKQRIRAAADLPGLTVESAGGVAGIRRCGQNMLSDLGEGSHRFEDLALVGTDE
jgi:hypothetical protein